MAPLIQQFATSVGQGLPGVPLLALLLGANVLANLIRNLWTFLVTICGHFTEQAAVFSRESVQGESRGHWFRLPNDTQVA